MAITHEKALSSAIILWFNTITMVSISGLVNFKQMVKKRNKLLKQLSIKRQTDRCKHTSCSSDTLLKRGWSLKCLTIHSCTSSTSVFVYTKPCATQTQTHTHKSTFIKNGNHKLIKIRSAWMKSYLADVSEVKLLKTSVQTCMCRTHLHISSAIDLTPAHFTWKSM